MPLTRSELAIGLVGITIGASLVAGPLLAREAIERIDPYGQTDPASVTSSCEDAKWSAVAAVSPNSMVTINVLISDPQQRDWEVRFRGGARAVEAPYYNVDDLAHAFASVGDLDDGPKRRVQVRPAGTGTWCAVEASLR